MVKPRPSCWRIWALAVRVPTLSAAVVPVLVGTAAAAAQGAFRPLCFIAALVAALLIQIGTNLTNDLFDFRKGADTAARLGPTRVTQSGLLSQRQMAMGAALAFGLAVLFGLYLVSVGGWPILVIGLLSIASGIGYTAGPWPLGYHGLGDPFVFVFFGVVAVVGTYYLHADKVSSLAFAISVPVGLLVTAMLVVNNLRDIETDRAAGKLTLAVRLGPRLTRAQYALLVASAYVLPPMFWLAGFTSFWSCLPLLTLPLAVRLVRDVTTQAVGPELNLALKRTAQLHLLFGALFALGLSL